MTDAIDLTIEQRNQLSALLHRFLLGVAVWAYGSRVKWTARPNSDLDLVAFTTPAQQRQVADLKDALAESNLPFPVDLHVWDDVPERFREIILKEYVVVQEAKEPGSKTHMPGEWCNITLGQVTDFLSGGTPSKDAPQYWGGSIPWVSAKDMKRFRLDDTEDHVTEDGVANGTKLVPSDTVLLLARGMTLLNDVPICVVKKPMTFNQDVKALRPKPGVRNEFLPYLLLGNKERLLSLVDLAGHGTGRLNSDELKVLDVVLPPEPEQRAIAHILGTLDDKIELNRKMNETLETMARGLFKSWFVDFDPVRAKAEGRDPGLPKATADLFPDSFEDSELGEIPREWEVKAFADTIEIVGGGTPKTSVAEYWDGDIPWFSVVDAPTDSDVWVVDTEKKVTHAGVKNSSTRVLPVGTTIISARGTVGRITLAGVPMAMNQSCYGLRGRTETHGFFTYFSTRELVVRLQQHAHGSVFDTITRDTLAGVSVVAPTAALIEEFEKRVAPSLQRIRAGLLETRSLAGLRDTLLPKLISGELRMKGVERLNGRLV
ncbi:MAG: restriction endonuclease subunit S [Nitrospira sp.]|nr:restriction endonuclease subunit S [Nitrospira sp.]